MNGVALLSLTRGAADSCAPAAAAWKDKTLTRRDEDQNAIGAQDRQETEMSPRLPHDFAPAGDGHGGEGQQEVSVPKTTDAPSDTGAGDAANKASQVKVSDSVTHGGTSGHGQGEPVPKSTNIPDPVPHHSGGPANEGSGPAPLGS